MENFKTKILKHNIKILNNLNLKQQEKPFIYINIKILRDNIENKCYKLKSKKIL